MTLRKNPLNYVCPHVGRTWDGEMGLLRLKKKKKNIYIYIYIL